MEEIAKKIPFKKKQSDRDSKIMKLFAKWLPVYGRTATYQKIATSGIASYSTVVSVVKANEPQQED